MPKSSGDCQLGEYMSARLQPPVEGHKTCCWHIVSLHQGSTLGEVRWHGPWRQYVFHPRPATAFNAGCLRVLAEFCESMRKVRASDVPAL